MRLFRTTAITILLIFSLFSIYGMQPKKPYLGLSKIGILPDEIIAEILRFLYVDKGKEMSLEKVKEQKNIINFSVTCKYYYNNFFIKKDAYYEEIFTVVPRGIEDFESVKKFIKKTNHPIHVDLQRILLIEDDVAIDLLKTNPENIVKLSFCNCVNLSDDAIEFLKNLEKLYCLHCPKITDKSIGKFKKLKTLYYCRCQNHITAGVIGKLPIHKLFYDANDSLCGIRK